MNIAFRVSCATMREGKENFSRIYQPDISYRHDKEGGDVSIERQLTSGWLSFVKAVYLAF